MRRLVLVLVLILPVTARAEWHFMTNVGAVGPGLGTVQIRVGCNVSGRADVFIDGYEGGSGATAFLLGEEIEDVYDANCTDGMCVLQFDEGGLERLLERFRTERQVGVLEYRTRDYGPVPLDGAAGALDALPCL